jgi:hypothetical protein
MKVLVTASETVSADRLRAALGRATDDVEIMVVAPAAPLSAALWFSDADEAIRRAGLVQRETVGASRTRDWMRAVTVVRAIRSKRWRTFSSPSRPSAPCSLPALFQTGATTRASTLRHCSNGLACRPNRLNEQPDVLSVQRRQVMRRVSHL